MSSLLQNTAATSNFYELWLLAVFQIFVYLLSVMGSLSIFHQVKSCVATVVLGFVFTSFNNQCNSLTNVLHQVGIVGDIRESMLEEVDFQKEAVNIETFQRYLENMGLDGQAKAPKVYQHCSTRRVLTMERLYGVPLTDLDSIRSLVPDPEMTLVTALNVWYQDLHFHFYLYLDVLTFMDIWVLAWVEHP